MVAVRAAAADRQPLGNPHLNHSSSHDPRQGHGRTGRGGRGEKEGGAPPAAAPSFQQTLIAGAQPSAGAFSFQGTLYSALITGTLEHVCGSKYSDLEVTRKTLVPIHSKCRRQGGEQREEAEKLSR